MVNPGDPEEELPEQDLEQDQLQDQAPADDEPEEEPAQQQAQDAESPEQPEQPERQPSRGERRFQALSNEIRQRDEQINRLNQRLDNLLTQPQFRPAQETPEARQQRLAQMTPEDQMRYEIAETRQQTAQQF